LRFLATQRGLPLSGVYVAARWRGSPSERYGLQPTMRITAVNGRATPDLDAFAAAVAGIPTRGPVRPTLRDLKGQPRVATLQTDDYWPAYALSRSGRGFRRGRLEPLYAKNP
jgi:S1-C subfamily serine protease